MKYDKDLCECGHERKYHGKSHSINYTQGRCNSVKPMCECQHFLMKDILKKGGFMENKENQLEMISKGNVFESDGSYKRAMEIAKKISESDLIPAAYHNKPANCIIALDIARQVRSSPLIVMQNLNIIRGKPSWSSTYIAAAVRTKFKILKVLTTGEGMNKGCQVTAYDDKGNVIAEGVRVTMEMAKAEGWIDKVGSKWKTMPDLMLQYRANSFFGRVFCPDVLLGLHSEYEVLDVQAQVSDVPDPFDKDKDNGKDAEPADTTPPKEEIVVEDLEKIDEKVEKELSEKEQILKVKLEIEESLKPIPTKIYKYSYQFMKKDVMALSLVEIQELKKYIDEAEKIKEEPK